MGLKTSLKTSKMLSLESDGSIETYLVSMALAGEQICK